MEEKRLDVFVTNRRKNKQVSVAQIDEILGNAVLIKKYKQKKLIFYFLPQKQVFSKHKTVKRGLIQVWAQAHD